MSVARKKPRDRRSPSSLAKLAQCQGASRAHLPQQWKRGVQDARRGGGTPSWSPFLHVSPPKKSGRPAEWRTRRSPATADFHGAFFFRGRVRRATISRKHGRDIRIRGERQKGRNTWAESRFSVEMKSLRDAFHRYPCLARRFTFLLSFLSRYFFPCFDPSRFDFRRRNLYFNLSLYFENFYSEEGCEGLSVLCMETVIYFLERGLRNARLYVKKFISKRTDGYETRGS